MARFMWRDRTHYTARQGRESLLEQLRTTLNLKVDPSLPSQTQLEQLAGRNRIMIDLRRSIARIGLDELRARFGRSVVDSTLQDIGVWKVITVVEGSQGTRLTFSDDLMDFPSDETIAQIALIV